VGDVIGLEDEAGQEGRPLLKPAMRQGRRINPQPPFADLRRNAAERIAELPPSVAALNDAVPLTVRISRALDDLARSVVRANPGPPARPAN
jgi:nicotinate phosphoribosyltransferase